MQEADNSRDPIKDEDAEHPIASAWRATLREIVRAFVEIDSRWRQGSHPLHPFRPTGPTRRESTGRPTAKRLPNCPMQPGKPLFASG